MKDFKIENYDADRNYAIEASAGTGKTYQIIEIIKHLVKDKRIPARDILAVTYTNKAVGELKQRIRKELKDVADEISIFTIHSFCKTIIEEFGVSASLPLKLDFVEDREIRDFAERYLREPEVWSDFPKNVSYTQKEGAATKLAEGVKNYYLKLDGSEDGNIISLLDTNLHLYKNIKSKDDFENYVECDNPPVWARELNSLYQWVQLPGTHQRVKDLWEAFKSHDPENNRIGRVLTFYGQGFPRRQDNPDMMRIHPKLKYINDVIRKFDDNPAKLFFVNHLPIFYKRWQQEKEARHIQTYDDMLRYVRETVLTNPSFRDALRNRYKYAIIDEFQDTNQKQFDIFKSVFLGKEEQDKDPHHIIVVGDKKQSIYSFQGADVDVFQKAVKEIGEDGEREELSYNWRSTPELVHTFNGLANFLFPEGCSENKAAHEKQKTFYKGTSTLPVWVGAKSAADSNGIDYVNENEFAEIAVQTIIDCCKKENNKTNLRLQEQNKKTGISERDVSFKDFVILTRTSSEVPPIERALKKAGIPFIRYGDKRLFSGKECAHWIALLEAIALDDLSGDNRKKISKALYTAFFGYALDRIDSDEVFRDGSEELEQLRNWKQFASVGEWETMVESILFDSRLTQITGTLSAFQSLSVYKQIGEYCISLFSEGSSLDAVIRQLSNLASGISSEDDDAGQIVARGTDFDCVQIMTMHSAKGLEFPVVIVVGGYKNRARQKTDWYMIKNDGKRILRDKKVSLTSEVSAYYDDEDAEWRRLLYVALTRAKHLLILPYYRGNENLARFLSPWIKSLEEGTYRKLLYGCDPWCGDLMKESREIINGNVASGAADEGNWDKQKEQLTKLKWNSYRNSAHKHSYSSLSHKEYEQKPPVKNPDEEPIDKEGEMVEGLSGFDESAQQIGCFYDSQKQRPDLPLDYPRGTEFGTAIHEVFEKTTFSNLGTSAFDDTLRDTIIACFKAQRIPTKDRKEWIEGTIKMVKSVLTAVLPEIHGPDATGNRFALSSLKNEDLKREAEFNFNHSDQKLHHYFNGFVDLLFRRGDYYSIVDWKSDHVNDQVTCYSDGDVLKQHVDEHYSIQRVLYSYCLIEWLKTYYKDESEEDIFRNHFGGVYYVFIRGCAEGTGNGIYCQTWNSWNDLKDAFDTIAKSGGIR